MFKNLASLPTTRVDHGGHVLDRIAEAGLPYTGDRTCFRA